MNSFLFSAEMDFGNVDTRTFRLTINRYIRRTLHGRARALIARAITTMTPGVVADLMKNVFLNSCISQLADALSTRSRARRYRIVVSKAIGRAFIRDWIERNIRASKTENEKEKRRQTSVVRSAEREAHTENVSSMSARRSTTIPPRSPR